MENKDTRWIQRLNNYEKSFKQLELGVELATDKNFFEYLGETNIQESRDASMNYQLSIINYQLSIKKMNYIINHFQLSIINFQLKTICLD